MERTNGYTTNQWVHSTFELIESHGNILRHSIADFATAIAKYVTENAEVVCPHAVIVPMQLSSPCSYRPHAVIVSLQLSSRCSTLVIIR